jgi:hypothetical protein
VRAAAYPGSFDPLTIAHLAVADAAVAQLELERIDLVISRVALGKDHEGHHPIDVRLAAIEAAARNGRPWLAARVTDERLVADIAAGYDAVVMGADKWHQVVDVAFYDGSEAARDGALARLPLVAIAPRSGSELPTGTGIVVLDVAPEHHEVSSSAVRDGRIDWRA